jgi:hypothetical protein
MNESMQKYFGEPISVYTEKQAIDDGVLMKNPSIVFPECDVLTTNLFGYLDKMAKLSLLTNTLELLELILKKASFIYIKQRFKGDNDKDFFVIKGNNHFKSMWFVRNDHHKITAMLPEDY